jgi:hypothetical protein
MPSQPLAVDVRQQMVKEIYAEKLIWSHSARALVLAAGFGAFFPAVLLLDSWVQIPPPKVT